MTKPLYRYAGTIRRNWDNMDEKAKPFVDAMFGYNQPRSNKAKEVVRNFLANARRWRGEIARNTKKELREIVA